MARATDNSLRTRLPPHGSAATKTRWVALAAVLLLACGGRRATIEEQVVEREPASAEAAEGADADEPSDADGVGVAGTADETEPEARGDVAATAEASPAQVSEARARATEPAAEREPVAQHRPVEPASGATSDPPSTAGAPSGDVTPTPERPADVVSSSPERTPRGERFLGHEDGPILEALATEELVAVERGRGGRSLSFRVTLADGTDAYFKPDQTFNGMSWNAEVVAHHLDRALGLGRVAPVVSRELAWSELEAAASGDRRVGELRVRDGRLVGALIWWVPERLVPLELPVGWEAWLRIEGDPPAVTPFQRPASYHRARAEGPRRAEASRSEEEAPAPDRPERVGELSDLMVFDYLAQNLDRWGTHNTNVRTMGEGGPLMFLDNAAAFTLRSPRVRLMDLRLRQVQRFRRETIDAVRALDLDAFAARLAEDPNGPLLDERQLANLATRREHLIAYVDRLVERHGEDAVFL